MTTTVPIPKNSDELAEMIADQVQLSKIVASKDTLRDFITSYANKAQGEGTDLQRLVAEESQKALAELLKGEGADKIERLNLKPDSPVSKSPAYNRRAPGAALDAKYPDWVSYFRDAWDGAKTQEALTAKAEMTRIRNEYGSTVPSDGGFLIPERLRADLLQVPLEMSVVRQRARVVPMDSLMVPYPTIDSVSNASSVHGGVTGYWTEEGGDLTDSSPKFGRIELIAKKLTLYSEIPNELFQDSIISLQQFMGTAYPEALAWFEDIAFIAGTGVGQPLGWLNADAAVSVAKESGQGAGTILWENIVKAYSRMLPSSIGRAVWVCHIDTLPELATMALSVGTGGSAVWIGNGGGVGTPPVTILGRPVVFTEKVSSVGSAGDVNFVDFGYYLIGDRQAMQASTSTEFKFGSDKTAMRLIQRVDGRPWLQSAITPQTGSNTLSPFVKIADRA